MSGQILLILIAHVLKMTNGYTEVGNISCSAEATKIGCAMDDICTAHCLYPCHERRSIVLWGTGVYTYDSPICKAAVHDFRISIWNASSRNLVLKRIPFYDFYQGSVRFGVSSTHYGKLGCRSCGSFIFLSPRVSEEILDVTTIHHNYLYLKKESHVQLCIIQPKSWAVHFGTYINREQLSQALNKNLPAEDYGDISVHRMSWPPEIQIVGGSGYQCIPEKSMLSVVTSLAMRRDAYFMPHHLTVTVSVNESVTIIMQELDVLPYQTFWQKDSKTLNAYIRVERQRTSLHLPNVQVGSAGIYSLEYAGVFDSIERRSITRLIVRVCPEWRFGNNCSSVCPDCLNGGVCHDITGVCVCAPGFHGIHCEEACDPGFFGKACSLECLTDITPKHESCRGLLICLPDPYGCSCGAGFKGISCNTTCDPGEYGAGCRHKRTCHCKLDEPCDIFTGLCPNGCLDGWHGDGCTNSYPLLADPPTILETTQSSAFISFRDWSVRGDEGVGTAESYIVVYKEVGDEEWLEGPHVLKNISKIHNATLSGLKSGKEYVIAVVVVDVSGSKQMKGLKTQNLFTLCSQPSSAPVITGSDVTETLVNVSWTLPPEETWNCQNVQVLFRYSSVNHSDEVKVTSSFHEFYSKPFVASNITVCLKAGLGEGSEPTCSDVLKIVTKEGSPGPVKGLTSDMVTSYNTSIHWKEPHNRNGIIRLYVIHYWQTGWAHICRLPYNMTENSLSTNSTSTVLTDLRPSALYTVAVSAVTLKMGSVQILKIKTKGVAPDGVPVNLVFQDSRNILTWKEPYCNTTNGDITLYYITVVGMELWDTKERNYTSSKTKQDLSDLVPYTTYMANVFSANAFGSSHRPSQLLIKTKRAAPPPPKNLVAFAKSSNSISLTWNPPYPAHGLLSHYVIEYKSDRDTRITYKTLIADEAHCSRDLMENKSCYFINGLHPDVEYSINLEAFNYGVSEGSGPVTIKVDTTESIPDSPVMMNVLSRNDTELEVNWLAPYITNGDVTFYRVNVTLTRTAINSNSNTSLSGVISSEEDNYTFSGLLPSSSYRVCVEASTSVGYGPPLCKNFSTSRVPLVVKPPLLLKVLTDGVVLKLHPKMFFGGPFNEYFIIVCHMSLTPCSEEITNSSFFLPQNCLTAENEVPKIYVAVKLESLSMHGTIITVGDGECRNGYRNARLQPQGTYVIGVAVYGMDERYSKVKYTKEPVIIPSSVIHVEHSTAVAFGFLIPILIILTVIGIYVYCRRPKFLFWQHQRFIRMRILPKRDEAIFAISNAALDEDEIETESLSEELSNRIAVNDLSKFVENDTSRTFIRKEFMTLPRGERFPCDVARMPENKAKNRYGNLLPYDHSRVVLELLQGVLHSDYIHANYIDGYKAPKRYIATQGPKAATAYDFWRMVWQEGCCKIVMATNIVEGGRPKCEKYWPDEFSGESEQYGDLVVTSVDAEVYADFTIRTLTLCKTKKKTKREVKHFHFQTWPDHGVPTSVWPVNLFVDKIREYRPESPAPIVVHCSAGIGRTGTLILIDSMLDMAESEHCVDLLSHLYRMRCQRNNILENIDQYLFVYRALSERFSAAGTSIPYADFLFMLSGLNAVDSKTGMTRIEKEFQILSKQSQGLQHDGAVAVKKRRNTSVLSSSHSLLGADHSSFSPVYVNRYRERNAFIVMGYPHPSEVDDFWSAVYQENCKTIILLQEVNFSNTAYWPTEGNSYVGKEHKVVCTAFTEEDGMAVYDLTLTFDSEKNVPVRLFHLTDWKTDEIVPRDKSSILILMDKIDRQQCTEGKHTVAVQCLDGVSACGLFCASVMVCDRITSEKLVDVFYAVKSIRINRPQFIQSLEQYEFLYELANTYLSRLDSQ